MKNDLIFNVKKHQCKYLQTMNKICIYKKITFTGGDKLRQPNETANVN